MRTTLTMLSMLLGFALMARSVCGQDQAPGVVSDADTMLEEIRAIQPPPVDQSKVNDPEYRRQYSEQVRAALAKRAELAKQFYDKFPDHPEAAKVMEERWQALAMTRQQDVAMSETQTIIAEKPDSPVAVSARFVRAMIMLQQHDGEFDEQLQAVEEFVKSSPQDPRGGDLLMQLASWGTDDAAKQTELLKRVQAQYPNSRAAQGAAGKLRQVEGVGKPFELAFTDAINGKPISMSSLKGKVVVVDFWATWCGPCVAEMPHMKELYSQYKDKGVEFIGVSLDQPEDRGGLEALKKFVTEKGIEWPQYYQGQGWESEFSRSWGINSIPAVFIVDANGNLYSSNARGKLDTLIPELIAKRDGKSAGAR